MLAGSGLGAALVAVGLPAVAAPVAQPDPVVALFAEWRAAEDAEAALTDQQGALRADMVQRHGDFMPHRAESQAIRAAWDADPGKDELHALCEQANVLCDKSIRLLGTLTDTPATSLEGVRCKLLAAIDVMEFIERPGFEAEYQDTLSLAIMRDAARLLGGSAVA